MEKVVQINPIEPGSKLIRNFDIKKPMNKQKYLLTLLSLLVIVAGALSGYFLAGTKASGLGSSTLNKSGDSEKGDQVVEVANEEAFPDSAEGLMVKGGIEGDGTHHLDRELGPEKYVYLTSSVIDLDNFDGKKVKVWGQTLSGQSAGWLMDVGKVELVE